MGGIIMKKIMFNDKFGLTQAVLDGRKTMTRRIIKCPRTFRGEWVAGFNIHRSPSDKKIVGFPCMYGWTNKMFVKADLMPHHIKITGIKVERLQDISDEDCLKEGIIHVSTFLGQKIYHTPHVNGSYLSTNVAQEAFAYLIDKVSGKGTWESNPFVFAYEFVLFD